MANTQPILTERDERGHHIVPLNLNYSPLAGLTCDVCEAPATAKRNTQYGDFAACAEHEKHLAGWIADAKHESICEGRAAARFEDLAHGRDY